MDFAFLFLVFLSAAALAGYQSNQRMGSGWEKFFAISAGPSKIFVFVAFPAARTQLVQHLAAICYLMAVSLLHKQ